MRLPLLRTKVVHVQDGGHPSLNSSPAVLGTEQLQHERGLVPPVDYYFR